MGRQLNIIMKFAGLVDYEIVREKGLIDGIIVPLISGILFGYSWENLGINIIWSYSFSIMVLGVPVIVIIAWSLYVLLSYLAKSEVLPLVPVTFTLLDLVFQKIGLWRITREITPPQSAVLIFIGYTLVLLLERLTLRSQITKITGVDRIFKIVFSFFTPFLVFFTLSIIYSKNLNVLLLKKYFLRVVKTG